MLVHLWDVSHRERYGSMTKLYYRGAVGAVLVYDLTDPSSFEEAEHWRADLVEKVGRIPMLLIGNKRDMVSNSGSFPVPIAQAEAYAKKNSFFAFEAVSARQNDNIVPAMNNFLERVMLYARLDEATKGKTATDSFMLRQRSIQNTENSTENSSCCS